MNILGWLRTRDAGLSALRRSGRAAIVMPAVFAIAGGPIGDPDIATFAAFSALSTLLFVDFGGSVRDRIAQQTGLVLAGAALVCAGTLASREVWLATLVTLVIGFGVLFAGAVSSVLAGATTALLIGLVLPVTMPGPVGSIPDRLAGWLMGGAASILAVAVLWPAPANEPLRLPTARACALLARRLRAEADCVRGHPGPGGDAALRALAGEATAAVTALRESFFATPYRPTGLTTATRTLVRLIDEVVWLESVLERCPGRRPGPHDAQVCEVTMAAAVLLERGAALLEAAAGDPSDLEPGLRRLRQAREAMEHAVTSALPVRRAGTPGDDGVAEFLGSLEPGFRAQEMTFAISAIATNIELTVAARGRTWWQRLLGRRPQGVTSALSSAQERAGARVEPHSVWLHTSVRGAIALSLAVLVAEVSGVQHSFWVVFGTFAVLRSNALNTGQNAVRALLGTAAGFVIGGLLVSAIGGTTLLWVLLPPAVAFAGLAPAAISFAAGQAGFTVVLLIIYNIIEPAGWRIGLLRIEDVAIGCAVSLVAGALFWPRGAASALGRALSEAFADSAGYLRGAIEFGITRCDAVVPAATGPDDERRRAAAAARRLDDAFRGFLAERGTKHVPLADVTTLVTGVAVLRLTADAVLDLWARQDDAPAGDRATARVAIVEAGALLAGWYEETARALVGAGAVPAPLTHDKAADGRLIEAVRRDLTGADGHATATAVRVIWTADHIDAARRLQAGIVAPARRVEAVWDSRRTWRSLRRHVPLRRDALTG
jgi:uncharacterized membrane protein YccC